MSGLNSIANAAWLSDFRDGHVVAVLGAGGAPGGGSDGARARYALRRRVRSQHALGLDVGDIDIATIHARRSGSSSSPPRRASRPFRREASITAPSL
ncbi:MAG: hypothetical protein U1E87_04225 [Alphaproteobacteria bacterium]